MTDLHKGTHNCAAAIRESGAGISYPSLAPPTPAFLHPRSGSQPPAVHPQPPPVGASKGTGEGAQKHGHSVSTLLSFFHTSGRRRRWFLGGTTASTLCSSCSRSSFALLPLSLSFPLSLFLSSRFSSTRTQDVCRCTIFLSPFSLSL